jgi:hypothetical protein
MAELNFLELARDKFQAPTPGDAQPPGHVEKLQEDAGLFLRITDAVKQAVGPGKPAAREKTDWTIAINLTTDFGSGYGVNARMKELRDLAEKTKGTPVTLVVQAAYPSYSSWSSLISMTPDGHQLYRYIIKDGKMTMADSVKSQGYAKDTEGLLTFTGSRFDPKRLGLIMDSHGQGNKGLTGDTGKASVAEFVDAVKKGLKAIGKEKLDVLDFDCCLMSQDGVVDALKGLASDVVASPETEHIAGQVVSGPLEKLAKNPAATSDQVARSFVTASQDRQRASEQMWKWLEQLGIPKGDRVLISTLSHINTREYTDFQKNLDKFGDKMCEALKDEKSRAAIEKAIDETATYGGSGSLLFFLFGVGSKKYDLKDFTTRVVKAIEAGEIKDADGSLKASAQAVLDNRAKLVKDYFGHGRYEGLGGISTFLPGRDLRASTRDRAESTYKAELVPKDTGWGRFRYALVPEKKQEPNQPGSWSSWLPWGKK